MIPILVKGDDVRTGRKAKERHGRLRTGTGVYGLRKVFPFHLFYSLWLPVVNCGIAKLAHREESYYPILFKKNQTRKKLVFWKKI